MILERAAVSHPGLVRPSNEDAVSFLIPDRPEILSARGALFSVADGVGGLAAGEVASQTAVTVMTDEYFSPRAPFGVEAALRLAAEAANRRVYALAQTPSPELNGMQTTLTALVVAGRQAYIAHAGDTRLYRLRGGTLTQLTADHSEAAELLRLRLITPAQAQITPEEVFSHGHSAGRCSCARTSGGTRLTMATSTSCAPTDCGVRFLTRTLPASFKGPSAKRVIAWWRWRAGTVEATM